MKTKAINRILAGLCAVEAVFLCALCFVLHSHTSVGGGGTFRFDARCLNASSRRRRATLKERGRSR